MKNIKKIFIYILIILLVIIAIKLIISKFLFLNIQNDLSKSIQFNYSIEDKNQLAYFSNQDIEANIPIFMYHWIKDDTGDYPYPENMVKIDELKKQMEYLKENNYDVIFASEINKVQHYKKPVVLTFDDGWQDVYNIAFPYAKELNMKLNMYVITDFVGTPGYCTLEQLKEMKESGLVEIDSHTLSHPYLAQLSEEQVKKELEESKAYLKENLGIESLVICYPSGSQNTMVQNVAKENYKYGLLMDGGVFNYNSDNSNLYAIERIYARRSMSLDTFINYCLNSKVKIN